MANVRAPANDKKAKQSRLFLIGWIVLLTNHKALVFEVRVVGFVYVKGNRKMQKKIFALVIGNYL